MVDAEISSTLGKMILECCTVTKNHTVLAVSEKNSITLYWHTVSLENRLPDTRGFVLKWSTFRTLPLHGTDILYMVLNYDPQTQSGLLNNSYCKYAFSNV